MVLAVALILDVRPAGCQNLLLDSAHGQYLATQRDFTGHGQVWLHFPLCKGRSQRCEHGDPGRRAVLGDGARGNVNMDVPMIEEPRSEEHTSELQSLMRI